MRLERLAAGRGASGAVASMAWLTRDPLKPGPNKRMGTVRRAAEPSWPIREPLRRSPAAGRRETPERRSRRQKAIEIIQRGLGY